MTVKKVLLTGSNGQLARALHKNFPKHHNLVALSKNDFDISDMNYVENYLKKNRFDLIINSAAYTNVDSAEDHPRLATLVNKFGSQNLSKASSGMCPIIHISTDYVFNGRKETPYLEDDETDPINNYGKSKLDGELEISSHNPERIIIRTSWLFSEFGNNFLDTILRISKEKNLINIVSDQFGGPTSVNDLSLAIIFIAEEIFAKKKISWGTYHFSGYPYTSWKEFAQEIVNCAYKYNLLPQLTDVRGIKTEEYITKATRPRSSMLDNSKIYNEFSIKPSNWKEELHRILKSYGN